MVVNIVVPSAWSSLWTSVIIPIPHVLSGEFHIQLTIQQLSSSSCYVQTLSGLSLWSLNVCWCSRWIFRINVLFCAESSRAMVSFISFVNPPRVMFSFNKALKIWAMFWILFSIIIVAKWYLRSGDLCIGVCEEVYVWGASLLPWFSCGRLDISSQWLGASSFSSGVYVVAPFSGNWLNWSAFVYFLVWGLIPLDYILRYFRPPRRYSILVRPKRRRRRGY